MKKLIFLMMLLPFVLGGCAQKKNYQSMTTPEFQKLLSDDAIQIVDARTPEEYRDGHIEKAVNMDIKDVNFDKQIQELDADKPVAVYCKGGVRSKKAADKLAKAGFKKIYDLDKGINDWIEHNYPVVKSEK